MCIKIKKEDLQKEHLKDIFPCLKKLFPKDTISIEKLREAMQKENLSKKEKFALSTLAVVALHAGKSVILLFHPEVEEEVKELYAITGKNSKLRIAEATHMYCEEVGGVEKMFEVFKKVIEKIG